MLKRVRIALTALLLLAAVGVNAQFLLSLT